MKCKCPNCRSVLYIDNDQLKKVKRPKFRCPSCNTGIEIKPSSAKCGHCNKGFKYYDYKFNGQGPAVVKCHHCATLNRVKIHY